MTDVLDLKRRASDFELGVLALLSSNFARARGLLQSCVEGGYDVSDALFLLAICSYLEGQEHDALELLAWRKSAGPVSATFFATLGRIVQALGPRGDDLRAFLQRHRHIPWQLVGKLGGEIKQTELEPWFFSRSTTNPFPRKQQEFADPREVVEKYILPGFVPATPLFCAESAILTMGSCFAQELRNYLSEQGKQSDWLFVPPGLNNTFALRNFIEWCLTGNRSSDAYWYDEGTTGGAFKWDAQAEQQNYREVFERIDGLVLTIGLAEVWYDTVSGGVFWRGVPKSVYNADDHKCRISSVEENAENLASIISMLHKARPNLPIIMTLSPVPLRATFEPISCFAADCLSKSTLRVAIDRIMQAKHPNVMYWPSFEIVRWLGGHLPFSMFGDDGNTRHVNRATVKLILDSFISHYYQAQSATA